ncbi:hypothetical protein KUTeg_007532 [Tegillarca granosa]|uniref:Uncharacterized protein n=1 Tax=Tegillarca granosa TaxID=220873 RepID=A0ABQ9FDH3_TEGGR|nr:hypothetical protein KUTeg_007532 [Tegillarca granosa]
MENTQEFWERHKAKLNECLQFRQFEEDVASFRDKAERKIEWLKGKMYDTGENVKQADSLIRELENFAEEWQEDFEQGELVLRRGKNLSNGRHFAGDAIRRKSMEIQSVYDQYKDVRKRRRQILDISRVLHKEVENARKWCEEGKYLLANQQLDSCKSHEGAEEAIINIDAFLKTSSQLEIDISEEIQQLFEGMKILENIKEALQTVEDVRTMCENRKVQIKKSVNNLNKRPVEIVEPEPIASKHMNCKSDSDTKVYKRSCKMQELLKTEMTYVADLEDILKGYYYKLDDSDMEHIIPKELIGKKDVLFGNLKEIYDFHNRIFLPELQNCKGLPAEIGKCFINRANDFHLYGVYCQNKINSDALYHQVGENNQFFRECKRQFDINKNENTQCHQPQMQPVETITLPLGSYLLKPIQRITKYHLFLSDMLEYTEDDSECTAQLQEALNAILELLRCVNDSMHQMNIVNFPGDLSDQGRLLMQDEFTITVYHRKQTIADLRVKQRNRHIFLYENSILFCKKKVDQQQRAYFDFKSSLKITQVGLTENIRGDERKFELWSGAREDVYLIQALNQQVKDKWLKEIKKCLTHKFDHIQVLK